jgi:DNA polymerase-1
MNMEQLLRHSLAPAPGKVIIHADKSQLELNVMACVAEDDTLADALNTGDVYGFDACGWFSIDPATFEKEGKHKKVRKACKIIHLGKQYGAGDRTVWTQALRQDRNFTWNQTRLLGKQFDKSYNRTTSYWDEEMARVMACGYSEGRVLRGRRYYPALPERSEVVNYPVQRSAAELMNLEVLELWNLLKKEVPTARIIVQLHDAVDVECFEKDEQRVSRLMSETMNRSWKIGNRERMFPVEMKVARASKGETWAEL